MRRYARFGLLAFVMGFFGDPGVVAAREKDRSARESRKGWLLLPLWPGRFRGITSRFGRRKWGRRTEFHRGVDLAAPRGSFVVAARGGRVTHVAYDRRCGWYVKVAHPFGWQTVYCHLLENPRKGGIRPGIRVVTGQVVGRVGRTGRSTGYHLHFGLIDPTGRHRDPEPHLLPETWSQRWIQALYASP